VYVAAVRKFHPNSGPRFRLNNLRMHPYISTQYNKTDRIMHDGGNETRYDRRARLVAALVHIVRTYIYERREGEVHQAAIDSVR
jgi:hypothetical protein